MSQARARAPLTPEFDRALREAAAISWFEPPEPQPTERRPDAAAGYDGARVTAAPGERRTVVIRGQASPPRSASARRRPPRTARERVGARPDRIALWAVLLGFVLVLIAASTSHAAVAPHARGADSRPAPLSAPAR